VLALGTVALHLLFAGHYGYFRDELYFIACGQHLAWGYVDQPPLIAVAARLAAALFGESLTGLRLLPALAAGGLVLLTARLARRLGGGPYAQALSGMSVALAPIFLAFGHLLTMNAFEPLLWLGCSLLLVELIRTGEQRLWLAVGAVVGVGMLNKHSMAFFTLCLALGLVLTPQRRLMRSRWLVLGAGLATLLVLPHVPSGRWASSPRAPSGTRWASCLSTTRTSTAGASSSRRWRRCTGAFRPRSRSAR
jgi:4-amino-4-deoxy-L-arabinose transferase-like glycosyltransferase